MRNITFRAGKTQNKGWKWARKFSESAKFSRGKLGKNRFIWPIFIKLLSNVSKYTVFKYIYLVFSGLNTLNLFLIWLTSFLASEKNMSDVFKAANPAKGNKLRLARNLNFLYLNVHSTSIDHWRAVKCETTFKAAEDL